MTEFGTGEILVVTLILNLWFVTLLFHKLSYLEWSDPIITLKFWKWYLFWWVLIPHEFWSRRDTSTNNQIGLDIA